MPFGKLHEFNLDGPGNWPAYVRLVEQFILLNDIKNELRVATLVTHVGAATYSLMCDLCAPDNPEDKDFTVLVNLVKNHLEPKRSEIAERHTFRQRRQGDCESIGVFLQNLKRLATYCNFGSKLEENIRDQFVSGLRSEDMRSRLFAEPVLDYKKAVELALALEAAERHAAVAVARSAALGVGAAGLMQGGGGEGSGGGTGGASGLHRVGEPAPRPRTCWRCGKEGHAPHKCRYKSYVCDVCKVKGHLALVCAKSDKKVGKPKYQNFMETEDSSESDGDGLEGLYSIKGMSLKRERDSPYYCELVIENKNVLFEVDTGSKISAISKTFYDNNFSNLPIVKECLKLQSYTGDAIVTLGWIEVRVSRGRDAMPLPLFVIEKGGPPLLGRRWLRELKYSSINLLNIRTDIDPVILDLKNEFPEVFSETLGAYKHNIKLYVDNDHAPVFIKARSLPLALRAPVEQELERLQREQVIYKVERSDYGTPIVPVIKPDGSIRLCGDYKITVNKILKDFHFPLPRIEEIFAALSGGEQYSKLDLKTAYLQLVLNEESQPLTAITTHLGVFVYRRAPFGLKCLPEKFQKLITETLSGLKCVVAFIDDICVTGHDRRSHMENLRNVLSRLREAGLTVKFTKCEFFKEEVTYLGYRINKNGLHTDKTKVEAITKMPSPGNVSQLRALLGFINYYSRFIQNISTMLQPLHALLKKGVPWLWSDACEDAFRQVKEVLCGDPVLAHYSPELPLVLAVDSSAYGLGAVLSQRYPGGAERVVCCASRTLNPAEQRYSQIDKEALAIVYGVTRHHQYLFGRKFTLRSDHKALSYIFGNKKGIPQTAASRLQRYAVRLAAYDFDIVYVSTDKNGNADGLSRLPLQETNNKDTDEATYLHFVEDTFPLSHKDVANETKKDKLLCTVYGYIMSGWPTESLNEEEHPYFHRRENLHISHGCIVWGYRVVIPVSLREAVLNEIHSGHVGVVRMKQLARNYLWWPHLDADIESRGANCAACRSQLDAPPHAAPVPYRWPADPWARLHADFLQHQGKYYLVLLDAHTKWLEVFLMSSGTSAKLVANKLRETFSRFGLPKQLVTDGGPPFRSTEFEHFLTCNGVKHILIAPYHPASNGAAENAVKTVKKVIKKATIEGKNIERALHNFLLVYRNSAHSTTQREPAVAMFGRRLRMRLDLLRGSTAEIVREAQDKQVRHAGGATREVVSGDAVFVRNYSKNGPKWTEGEIIKRTGAVNYEVRTEYGQQRKHIDQIMPKRKTVRYSTVGNDEETKTETAIGSPSQDHWESAPNSPLAMASPSQLKRAPQAQPDPVYGENSQSPSSSGAWVNKNPRGNIKLDYDE